MSLQEKATFKAVWQRLPVTASLLNLLYFTFPILPYWHIHVLTLSYIDIWSYCYIYVNTYIQLYIYTVIQLHLLDGHISIRYTCGALFYFFFFYVFILSLFSTTHVSSPYVVIYRLLLCKGSAGRKHGKYQSPIGDKLFMTLRNHRLRFPKNFDDQLFALRFLFTNTFPCT